MRECCLTSQSGGDLLGLLNERDAAVKRLDQDNTECVCPYMLWDVGSGWMRGCVQIEFGKPTTS